MMPNRRDTNPQHHCKRPASLTQFVLFLCRHETFLPAPAETEKAANEKAKKEGEKPKDKVRTAKKIQKDMEKWAKMLNQKKESQKVAVAPPAVLPAPAAPHTQKGGHRRVQVLPHNGGSCL
jgi:hypothetical protein